MGGNFCPYYKDKEVFKQFNQIITALGGKPMSEEEFKSRELRHQRSGLDYSAMEAAYRMWELNKGNSYDKAPNGEDSIIFQSLLLKNNNDVNAAIRAKSAIYTKSFADKYGDWLGLNNENEIHTILKEAKANGTFMKAPNGKDTNLTEKQWLLVRTKAFKKWFGDWENDPKNASKIVDENGEPKVVYHGTDSTFTVFDPTKQDGEHKAFYFTDSQEMAKSYKGGTVLMPLFLNVRDSYEVDAKGKNWNNIELDLASKAKTPIEFAELILKQQQVEIETAKRGYYDDFWGKFVKDEKYTNEKIRSITERYLPKLYKRYLELQDEHSNNPIKNIKRILEMRSIMKTISNIYKDAYSRNSYGKSQERVSTRDLDLVLNDKEGIIIQNVKDYGSKVENPLPHNVYVVYQPNQIKSATDNNGEFSKEDNHIRHSIIPSDQIGLNNEDEIATILKKAKANGTFMKAPNGKPTKLTERQWLLVRTKAFKEWFGDWEKVARSSKYRESNDIPNSITSATYQGVSVGPAEFDADMAPDGGKRIICLGNKYIGEIPIFETKDKIKMGGAIGAATEIEEEYRGKGYGKKAHIALANIAKFEGKVLYSDSSNSDAEDALWKSLVKEGIAEVVSEKPKVGHWNHTTYRIINDALPQADDIDSGDRDVSKVVDENGEPLVVYHHTDNSNLTEFSTDFDNYFAKDGGTKEAIFFDENKTGTLNRKYDIPVFLNIKDLHEYNETKEQLHQRGTTYRQVVNESAAENNIDGGVHMKDFDDNKMEHQSIWIVHNPNQIKSATDNNGEFSTEDNRIRNSNIPLDQNGEPALQSNANKTDSFGEKFDNAYPESLFGKDINNRLMNGESVSSNEILDVIIQKNTMSDANVDLAQALYLYNVPVKFEAIDDPGALMEFKIEGGERYIAIDAYKMTFVSKCYASDAFLHEIIHHVVEDTLYNPRTQAQREFRDLNKKLYDLFDKRFPASQYDRSNTRAGYYALTDEYEFAAEFATNKQTRELVFREAQKMYEEGNKSILQKIKYYINKFSKALFDKALFKEPTISYLQKKSALSDLQKYRKQFEDYIYNNKVFHPNVPTSQLLDEVYNNLNQDALNEQWFIDQRADLKRIHKHITQAYIDTGEFNQGRSDTKEEAQKKISKISNEIVGVLTKRLAAVLASNISAQNKSRFSQELQMQIQQFNSEQVEKYKAVFTFIGQIAPQLAEDVKNIDRINNKNILTSDTSYMYNKHDYFEAYAKILDQILKLFNNDSIVKLLVAEAKQNNEEDAILDNINKYRTIAEKCKAEADRASSVMDQILLRNVKRDLAQIGNETHSPNMGKFIEQLDNYGVDINSFTQYLGDLSRSDNESLKALVYLVNKANNDTDKLVHEKSIQLLKLQEGLKSGESIQDLYERDGRYATGYLVRKYNYGKFYNDYNEFMTKLNISLGLDPKNRSIPDDDELRKQWQSKKNDWLAEHCERKFTKDYYDNFINLSKETREAYDILQNQIRLIKDKCIDPDTGFYHYDKLSKSDWDNLNDLQMQKRQLKSAWFSNGELKQEGTVEYKIYKELTELDKNLFGDKQVKMNKKAWIDARTEVIKQCGGMSEMQKGRENSNFDWEKLDNWDSRNSKKVLKMNSDNTRPLLFEDIDNEMPELPVYEAVIGRDEHRRAITDGGKTYDDNKKTINQLLAPYRNQYTGEVDPKMLPNGIKAKIKVLESQNAKIARQAKLRDPSIRKLAALKGKLFKKYAKSETTALYKKYLSIARKKAEETNNPDYLDSFLLATGRYYDSIDDTSYRPYRWYTKIVAKPEYADRYMDIVPGDGWMDRDDNKFINDDFDESQNSAMVPKKSLYDNSEAYNKVMKSSTLKALYDAVYETIDQSNQLQTVRNYYDSYLLPQIQGSFFKVMKATKWREAWEYIKDNKNGNLWQRLANNPVTKTLGSQASRITSQNEQDDEFGQALSSLFSKTDDFGNTIEINNPDFLESSGIRADGRHLNMIPIYYTKKLEHPEHITSDLIGSVCEYYDKSVRFERKSRIKDTCEAIVDQIGQRKYLHSSTSSFIDFGKAVWSELSGKKRKMRTIENGKESRTYQAVKKFLDMNLYDIRQDKGAGVFWSRVGAMYRNAASIVNLGGNPMVALTGMLTLMYNDLINAITGYKYGKGAFILHPSKYIKSWLLNDDTNMSASKEVIRSLFKSFSKGTYISKRLTNDVHQLLMEEFNIAEQLERKSKNSNRWRILNGLSTHAIYGGMSLADYLTKGHIMEEVLMSYKYVDGAFVTKTDVIISNAGKSKEEIKAAMKKYDQAKSLRAIFAGKDFKLNIDSKYKDAYDDVYDEVKAKIQRYAASADGIPLPTQKAAISTSFLGACVLMHRQYLPLMLQERFQKLSYNMDTQEYEGGAFYAFSRLLMAPMIDARIAAGGSILTIFGKKDFWKTLGKEYKHEYRILKDRSERDVNGVPAYVYQQLIKQVMIELAMYSLVITPIVGLICAYADDDDNKDKLLLQFIAFLARRVQWESFTPYRANDVLNNFKTVSAAQSLSDKAEAFVNSILRWYSPKGSLFDTLFASKNSTTNTYNPIVDRGPYKGYSKIEKAAFKLFVPYHSAYEQALDSRTKRRYYENQIMQIQK